MPRSLKAGGAVMNIPIVNVVGKDTADGTGKRDYAVQLGALSSTLEHAVPEQLLTSPAQPGEAISAVKALQKASAAGQRIYQITPSNQASVLPQIQHDSATMEEIRSALRVGKTVLTHTSAVSVSGWSGTGYVLMDADTGDAAWKMAGGQNGGWLHVGDDAAGILMWVGASVGLIGASFAVPLLVFISAAIAILLAIDLYLDYLELDSRCAGFEYLIIASIAFSLVAVIASAGLGLLLGYISFILAGAVMPAAGSAVCRGGR